jgi:hypothetical protein
LEIVKDPMFFTWTLNCDRHHHDHKVRKPNPDNVFLSSEGVEPGKRRLIAMDHGLCFIGSGEDLTTKLANIEKVKDENVYGLFPEFCGRLRQDTIESCCIRLNEMKEEIATAIVGTVPREWDVSSEVRRTWSELIHRRAQFVAANVENWVDKAAPWFGAERE